MVIFHSYVKLPEGIVESSHKSFAQIRWQMDGNISQESSRTFAHWKATTCPNCLRPAGDYGDLAFQVPFYTSVMGVGDDPSAVYVESFNVETLDLQTPLMWEGWGWCAGRCFLEISWCEGMDLWVTLWLFNIAMENGPFIDGYRWFTYVYLLKMVIFHGKLLVITRWCCSFNHCSKWVGLQVPTEL